ncbi:MAG: pilus assembly protein [Eubacterium sp.]|nr:pilus assembly protein [Eubacterium sp.]
MNDRGSASIEAAIAFPLLLFMMLAFIYMAELNTVKGLVYEGAVETSEYMAEYAYLTDCFPEADAMDLPMATVKFWGYVDNEALLEKYIVGGRHGVVFLGSSFPDEEGYIDLWVTYYIHVNIPFIRRFSKQCQEHIRQRAYLGRSGEYGDEEEGEDEDPYVYVTPNGSVYHNSRNCTYLLPDMNYSSLEKALEEGYSPCEYCGSRAGENVVVTSYGEKYHSSTSCSRLRRIVERKKLSEVNLPPCSKCGN